MTDDWAQPITLSPRARSVLGLDPTTVYLASAGGYANRSPELHTNFGLPNDRLRRLAWGKSWLGVRRQS
jgi:hypothetical protein